MPELSICMPSNRSLAQSRAADLIPAVSDAQWTVGNEMIGSVWDRSATPADAQDKAASGFADLVGLGE